MRQPADMFDRYHESAALNRFVADDSPGATLGVVSGRRRQGKTFLLAAADPESLRRISAALTDHIRPITSSTSTIGPRFSVRCSVWVPNVRFRW